jgi:type VI protein secretion system component VasK
MTDAFYPAGAAQPQLTYTLRPSGPRTSTVELDADGTHHQWTTSLQKQFAWPAALPANQGAVARLHTDSLVVAFASRPGLWGIFRVMGDAEPRPLASKLVEWKYLRGGNGRSEPFDPPVRLEIVEFPGGADIFNPIFFEGLRCPVNAVVKAP